MALCDSEQLKIGETQAKKIKNQLELIKTYTGTVRVRHLKVEKENKAIFEDISAILNIEKELRRFCFNDNDTQILLKAIRLVTLANRKKHDFKGCVELANYKINEESNKKLFDALKKTWKDIKPHREQGKLIQIGRAHV